MKLNNKKHLTISLLIVIALIGGMLLESGVILADDTPVEDTPAGEISPTETEIPTETAIVAVPTIVPTVEITSTETPIAATTDTLAEIPSETATETLVTGFTETPAESSVTETPTLALTMTPTETPTETPTLTPTATAEQGMQWSLTIDSISKSVYSQASQLSSGLQAQGLESELSAQGGGLYSMSVSGQEGIEEIRSVLYGALGDAVRFIGGSAEIKISMPLASKQEITIDLESNPSTGYLWEVEEAQSQGVDMRSERDYAGRGGTGRPDKVTLTLNPGETGDATIHLVYRRPFDKDTNVTRHLTIQFSQAVEDIDLSDPNPKDAVSAEDALQAMGADETLVSAQSDLPSAFDWRSGDASHPSINIPIRDQGSCGSCWAFGTVGAMEAAMVRAGMPVTDLSEQFLVSCNKDGWDCDGGWVAHKYHTNTLGKSQSSIGAVLESDMPYTATDGGCYAVASHPYKLVDYASSTGASVSAIKSIIYNYGPVLASICVGDAFDDYYYSWDRPYLDIFSTDESGQCGSDGTNHMVVLMGWNDTGGYWILRNSWDTWWGEDGYMRIAYGTSKVARYISWVTFSTPLPAAPAMNNPAKEALTNDNTVDFSWQSSLNAVSYEIQVANSTTFSDSTIVRHQAGITGLTYTSSTLPDGRYYWRVRGRNAYNADGKWSTYRVFTVDTTPPAAPKLYKPLTGTTVIGTPTFTWLSSSGAVYYQFEYGTSTSPTSFIYQSSDQLTTLSHKPTLMAPKVTYYWFVKACDKAGNWGDWSAPSAVTIEPTIPLKPVLSTPATAAFTRDNTPELTWKAVDYAKDYHVQVSKSSTFSILVPMAVDQKDDITSSSFTTGSLSDGKYYWRVRARNVNGAYGSWCAARYFTVDTVAPVAPVLVAPLTDTTKIGTPAFSWKASVGASQYQFAYNTTGATTSFDYTSSTMTVLSFRPPTIPAMHGYYWFVRAIDKAGNQSDWSTPNLAYIEPTVPVRVTLSSPASGAKSTSTIVTLAWKAVTYGNIYQIQIDDSYSFGSVNYAYDSIAEATSMDVGPLPTGRWYWRVSAKNLKGTNGPWSAYRYFTVAP